MFGCPDDWQLSPPASDNVCIMNGLVHSDKNKKCAPDRGGASHAHSENNLDYLSPPTEKGAAVGRPRVNPPPPNRRRSSIFKVQTRP